MTMNAITFKCLAPVLLLGALALPAGAQTPPPMHPHSINARLHDQHERIHQGVGSGQLTRGEQYRLNTRDARIHRQERRDRRFDNGKLTSSERRHLQRELNGSSRAIYRDKHNNRVR